MKSFLCEICGSGFSFKNSLRRHMTAAHGDRFICEICKMTYTRKDSLLRHMRVEHIVNSNQAVESTNTIQASTSTQQPSNTVPLQTLMKMCVTCNREILVKDWRYHLRTNAHKRNVAEVVNGDLKVVKSCFDERIETLLYENKDEGNLDPLNFLQSSEKPVLKCLEDLLTKHESFKFNIELFCEYIKVAKINDEEETITTSIKSFQSKMDIVRQKNDLFLLFRNMVDKIHTKMQEFQERDSGWTLIRIIHLEINVNEYKPIRGSQYLPLPQTIVRKHACINVKNTDEYCFKWAIISALYPVNEHGDRPSSYYIENITASTIILRNYNRIEFGDLEFPMKLSDIDKFEEMNPAISINVFGYEETGNESCKIVGPFYCTRKEKNTHINLLLIQDVEKRHYVWIKNISRLIKSQITLDGHRIFLCNSCLQHFYSKDAYNIHKNECNKIVTLMPTLEKSKLKFEKYERQLEVPFVIYADFECILQNVDTCFPDPTFSSTTTVQQHVPCAFSYYIKCSYNNNLNKMRIHKGKDSAAKFVRELVDDILWIYHNIIANPKSMNPLTSEQMRIQEESNICHICRKYLDRSRVADHCHLTGNYRGPAHNDCNLRYRVPKFFPIFFHNFSGYDCHLFVKALADVEGDINLIPLNKELYVSLSKRIHVNETDTVELRFLDSSRFMQSSLESLAANLSPEDFSTTRSVFDEEEAFNETFNCK